jgi:hypothetical protein
MKAIPSITLSAPTETTAGVDGGTMDLTQFNALLDDPAAWSELGTYSLQLQLALNRLGQPPETLQGWASKIAALDLPMAFQASPISQGFVSGAHSAEATQELLNRWHKAGGETAAIAIDDPFAMAPNANLTPSETVAALTTFICAIQQNNPGIAVICCGTYPGGKMDANAAYNISNIDALQASLKAAGSPGIDYWRMDIVSNNIGEGRKGSWPELKSIQDHCGKIGIGFSLIYDAEGALKAVQKEGLSGPGCGDSIMAAYMESEAQNYREAGGHPDNACFQSWLGTEDFSLAGWLSAVLEIAQEF